MVSENPKDKFTRDSFCILSVGNVNKQKKQKKKWVN